jgi:heat shock protein HslJ
MIRYYLMAGAGLVAALSLAAGGTSTGKLAVVEGIEWQLVELEAKPVPPGTTLNIAKDGLFGKGPCNRYSAKFDRQNPAGAIGEVVTTRMACEGRMELESQYFAILRSSRGFNPSAENTLELLAPNGSVLAKFKK